MSYLPAVNLIEQNYYIEKYFVNSRIVVIKLVTKDKNEALIYKMKLLENKKNRRIYDIIEDKNILYIYIVPEENISDLLLGKISKEVEIKENITPIKKNEIFNLFQRKNQCVK